MSKKDVLKEVYNEIKEWKTELNKPGKKAVLEYLANKFKDEGEKEEKQRTTYCSICLKKTPYLFCSEKCKEISQEKRISQKKQISPSGLILTHDDTDYPVMLDLTDGYKLTCKEVTDDEWPDVICLLYFSSGPVNLELKVQEDKAESIKENIREEIITYKDMIKTAEKFIEPDKVMEIKWITNCKMEIVNNEVKRYYDISDYSTAIENAIREIKYNRDVIDKVVFECDFEYLTIGYWQKFVQDIKTKFPDLEIIDITKKSPWSAFSLGYTRGATI